MKANHLRKLLVPLLLGGTLLATALPSLAYGGGSRDHDRRYSSPGHSYGHNDRGRGNDHYRGRGSDDYRGKHSSHYRGGHGYPHYVSPKPRSVVHHYYYAPAPHYSPPPRVFYSYDPAVVIRFPSIIIR